MKASEAIAILESLDPSHEVTLTIKGVKLVKPTEPMPGRHTWVIGHEQWVPRDPNVYPYSNQINCNSTVH